MIHLGILFVLLETSCIYTVADYSSITAKKVVTMYTDFDPWIRGNLYTIEITGNSNSPEVCNLNSRLPLVQCSNTSLKYFVINSTVKSSMCL